MASGTSNVKLVPLTDTGRVTSAPNCSASALTKRVPRRCFTGGKCPVSVKGASLFSYFNVIKAAEVRTLTAPGRMSASGQKETMSVIY